VLLRYAHASRMLVLTTFLVGLAAFSFASPAHAGAFDDTAGQDWDEAVQALVDAEVLYGCRDGEFCPLRAVDRGQMASILVRALDLPEATEGDRFDDVEGTTHEDNINALAEAGITQGCSETSFCPSQSISRAEMATLLTRAFDVLATDEVYFDDTGGTHAGAIDAVAEAGIAAGCGSPLTAYCPTDSVERWQAALFVARSMDLVERVEATSLEERRQRQAEIDERERQRAEEERQAQQQAEDRDQMWEDLAQCESGGNWSINTGNGYYGGLQFSLDSWRWVGGSGYPHQNTRAEQIYRAEILLERQGWDAWPSCSRQLGYQ
jgi:hypothetical protein